MQENTKYSATQIALLLIISSVLLVKLILLPFVQTTDADAISRTLLAIGWKKHPIWISSSVWGPFHYYLNGAMLMIWNNPKHAIILLNIILSVLTLIPFFFFTRREFNEFGAIVATAFLAISPIVFRTSLMGLSETPYLLLVVLCMNCISKGGAEKRNVYFLLAGLCITLAAGFRFEAWLLLGAFGIVVYIQNTWRQALLFGLTGCIFPIIYLIQNYIQNGQALSGIAVVYNWHTTVATNNTNVVISDYLRRIWSFPFSWMIALGPLAAFVTIKAICSAFIRSNKLQNARAWVLPFWIVLLTMEYCALKGTLLLHHRFIVTLVVLSLPFSAVYFNAATAGKIKQAVFFAVLTIGLTFVYNTNNIIYLPRLQNQSAAKLAPLIEQHITKESGLIIDNWGWENTYYLGLQSGLSAKTMVMIDDIEGNPIPTESLSSLLATTKNGVILLVKKSQLSGLVNYNGSELSFSFSPLHFKASPILSNDTVTVVRYFRE